MKFNFSCTFRACHVATRAQNTEKKCHHTTQCDNYAKWCTQYRPLSPPPHSSLSACSDSSNSEINSLCSYNSIQLKYESIYKNCCPPILLRLVLLILLWLSNSCKHESNEDRCCHRSQLLAHLHLEGRPFSR